MNESNSIEMNALSSFFNYTLNLIDATILYHTVVYTVVCPMFTNGVLFEHVSTFVSQQRHE